MIPLFKVFMSKDVDKTLSEVLHSGYITQGKKVEEFERKLKNWFNYPYIITVNSATSALTMALRMMNLERGTEVISTPLTCFATTVPIMANGLKINWVDVDPKTCNIDLDDLECKISKNTKVLVFVHWAGNPLDMDKLENILNRAENKYGHRIQVLEDCAHAFGAKYKDKLIGTHGHYAAFSLQAIKHLTTGDGGLLFLPNEKEYQRAKLLRWYGIDRERRSKPGKDFRLENDIVEWGYKFHMNDINATIGLANLPHIDRLLEQVRDNAAFYNQNLKNVPGVELLTPAEGSVSSSWIYTIKVADKSTFTPFMNTRNIMVSQVHNRNDHNSCVAEFKTTLPQLDKLVNHIISIPVGWWVTNADREHIVESIFSWSNTYYHVRKLELSDQKEFTDILFQLNNFRGEIPNWEKTFRQLTQNAINLVIETNGSIVAYGKVLIEPKAYSKMGHIEDIVVDIKYRQKGYGRVLIKELIRLSALAGCYKTVLSCKDSLESFYTRVGLTSTGHAMTIRHT